MSLKSSCIGYYKFEGDSVDSVGANNGSASAITYSTGNGKIGQGAGFNGTSSIINLGSALSATNSLSYYSTSQWVYFNALPAGGSVIAGKYNNTQNQFFLQTFSTTEIAAGVCNTITSTDYGATTGLGLVTGQWYHIVTVFDGTLSGNSNRFKLFVNNVQKTLTFTNTIPSLTTNSTSSFLLGQLINAYFLNGNLDEFCHFNSALTTTEINQLYNLSQYPFTDNNGFLNFFMS